MKGVYFYKHILALAKTNLKVYQFLPGNFSDTLSTAVFKKQYISGPREALMVKLQGAGNEILSLSRHSPAALIIPPFLLPFALTNRGTVRKQPCLCSVVLAHYLI